jgi:hypothetical protein
MGTAVLALATLSAAPAQADGQCRTGRYRSNAVRRVYTRPVVVRRAPARTIYVRSYGSDCDVRPTRVYRRASRRGWGTKLENGVYTTRVNRRVNTNRRVRVRDLGDRVVYVRSGSRVRDCR